MSKRRRTTCRDCEHFEPCPCGCGWGYCYIHEMFVKGKEPSCRHYLPSEVLFYEPDFETANRGQGKARKAP